MAQAVQHRLPVHERLLVQSAITELRAGNPKLKNIALWGKIRALYSEYIVLRHTRLGEKIERTYFVSNDGGVSFAEVPPAEDWVADRCATVHRHFEGILGFVYDAPKDGTEQDPEENEDGEANEDGESGGGALLDDSPPPQPKLTELDRLSYTIREIDRACAVAPLGAYTMGATRVIAKDPMFKGLNAKTSLNLGSYVHMREAESKRIQKKLQRKSLAFVGPSFLDGIGADVPKGIWVARCTETKTGVTLRNMQYPGHEFVAPIEQGCAPHEFYNVYFGTGLRNTDLVFMV